MRSGHWVLAMVAAVGACACEVAAHGVHVFAEAEGREVVGMVYFSGGAKATDVTVRVLAADGAMVASVDTDREGRFSIEAPAVGEYRIVADLGDGHLAACHVDVTTAESPMAQPSAALHKRVAERADQDRRRSWVWLRLAAGLAMIIAAFAALRWIRRRRRPTERGA